MEGALSNQIKWTMGLFSRLVFPPSFAPSTSLPESLKIDFCCNIGKPALCFHLGRNIFGSGVRWGWLVPSLTPTVGWLLPRPRVFLSCWATRRSKTRFDSSSLHNPACLATIICLDGEMLSRCNCPMHPRTTKLNLASSSQQHELGVC